MTIPYNSITWILGSLALMAFGLRSFFAYRESGNEIAKIYCGISLSFAVGFLLFGLPAVFTIDTTKLIKTYVLSEAFIQLGMQFQVWLLWFIGLRNRVRLRYLLLASGLMSASIVVIEAFTSRYKIMTNPLFFVSMDIPLALIMKSILYIAVCWPLGYFFIVQARHQASFRSKLTSYVTGLVFLIISAGAVASCITSGGGDTYSSSVIDSIVFIGFLVVNLIPRRVISYNHSLAIRGS